jgi:hypothetical protein
MTEGSNKSVQHAPATLYIQPGFILTALGSPATYVSMSIVGQTVIIFKSVATMYCVSIAQMALSGSHSHSAEAEFLDVALLYNVTRDKFL